MPKTILQIVYCFFKNMALGRMGACGDTKYQHLDSFSEGGKIHRKGKVSSEPI